MDRRNFISMVGTPALVGLTISFRGEMGKYIEADKKGQYIFHFPGLGEQVQLDEFKKHLIRAGFKDPIVVGGRDSEGFQIFKLR